MVRIIEISRKETGRRLRDVPDGKRFWRHDGRLIKNLTELGEALNYIGYATFLLSFWSGEEGFQREGWGADG
jgi:hypothetical protein